jgi:hypothetical protein
MLRCCLRESRASKGAAFLRIEHHSHDPGEPFVAVATQS